MLLSAFVVALALQTPAPTKAPAKEPAAKGADDKSEEGGEERWVADFDEAATVAKKEHKDLLVDFTGSDWCIWCKRLHEEVFAFDSFLDAAEQDFVLVALDFPNSAEAKAKVPHPERNAELAKKYAIGGYPTVLLMTPDGDVFAKTGYEPGGPEKYVENVKKISASGKKLLPVVADLEKKYQAAGDADKPKLLASAIKMLEDAGEDSPFGARLATIVRTALKADPDDKKGMKSNAVAALLKSGTADEETITAARTLDAKNAKGLLEYVVAADVRKIQKKEEIAPYLDQVDALIGMGPFKNPKLGKSILANAAFMSKQHLNDLPRAKGYAKKLQALGIDDDANLKKLVGEIGVD